MNRRLPVILAAIAFAGSGAGSAAYWHAARLPRRFAPVVEGRLYRSGEVMPGHLRRLQREYGIQRVVSLLDADAPATRAERATVRQLGIEWHNVPLRGDGRSTPADRERILELLGEPNTPPTLVHCAAGATRTGLAVGLYRLRYQRWSPEQVISEMRALGFEDLPKHEDVRRALAAEAARDNPTPTAGE